MELQEFQEIEEIRRYWWRNFSIKEPCEKPVAKSTNANSLGHEQIGGCFVMCLIGLGASILISLQEFLYKAFHQSKITKVICFHWSVILMSVMSVQLEKKSCLFGYCSSNLKRISYRNKMVEFKIGVLYFGSCVQFAQNEVTLVGGLITLIEIELVKNLQLYKDKHLETVSEAICSSI